jgi:hypothetical protein
LVCQGERILWRPASAGPPKLRQRLFGPFLHGEEDETKALMQTVLKHVHNVAREKGFCICICNLDKEYALRSAFPPSKFETTFLQKDLRKDTNEPLKELARFTTDNFFDPRDI